MCPVVSCYSSSSVQQLLFKAAVDILWRKRKLCLITIKCPNYQNDSRTQIPILYSFSDDVQQRFADVSLVDIVNRVQFVLKNCSRYKAWCPLNIKQTSTEPINPFFCIYYHGTHLSPGTMHHSPQAHWVLLETENSSSFKCWLFKFTCWICEFKCGLHGIFSSFYMTLWLLIVY